MSDEFDYVPMNVHGDEGAMGMAIVPEDDLIKLKTENLPTLDEFKRWVAAVVVESSRQILTGRLRFKSAGEAARVARDFVAISRDLDWSDEADHLANARTPEERLDALAEFKVRAQTRLLALEE